MTAQNKTAGWLAAFAAVMLSLSFAAVPFYDWFCRVTGFGGTPLRAEAASDVILDQTMRIRFDGSVAGGMPWEFRPVQRTMDVRIGETVLAFYEAYNPTDRPVAGSASYNTAPDAASGYFVKIDCFCFTEQVLQPGERVEMPVTFYVDPAIVDATEGRYVKEITLSYTFNQIPLPEQQTALEAGAFGAVN
jgi:cytochrome c oxidase assembly protein subunit 11